MTDHGSSHKGQHLMEVAASSSEVQSIIVMVWRQADMVLGNSAS